MQIIKNLMLCVLLIACGCLTACTTYKTIPVEKAPNKVKQGDKLVLRMQHVDAQSIKVKYANEDEIVDSKNNHYDYRDIRHISRKQVSAVKTGTAVVGTSASATAFTLSTALGIILPVVGIGLTLLILL